MGPERASCGDPLGSLRLSQESTIIFGQILQSKIVRCPHDHLAVAEQASYDVTATYLRATGLRFFFSNLSLCGGKQNRRGHDDRKSVR